MGDAQAPRRLDPDLTRRKIAIKILQMHLPRRSFWRRLSVGRRAVFPLKGLRAGAMVFAVVLSCFYWVAAARAGDSALVTNKAPNASVEVDDNLTNGLGNWIWTSETYDRQNCQFWRSFEIPPTNVIHARIKITVDNEVLSSPGRARTGARRGVARVV